MREVAQVPAVERQAKAVGADVEHQREPAVVCQAPTDVELDGGAENSGQGRREQQAVLSGWSSTRSRVFPAPSRQSIESCDRTVCGGTLVSSSRTGGTSPSA